MKIEHFASYDCCETKSRKHYHVTKVGKAFPNAFIFSYCPHCKRVEKPLRWPDFDARGLAARAVPLVHHFKKDHRFEAQEQSRRIRQARSQAKKERAIQLRKQGKTLMEMERELGVSRKQIRRYLE